MKVAFILNGRANDLSYLVNSRKKIKNILSNNGWDVQDSAFYSLAYLKSLFDEYESKKINDFVFFYIGHGDISGHNGALRLLLVDKTYVNINTLINDYISLLYIEKTAIVLDACYSGNFKGRNHHKNIEYLCSSDFDEKSYESDDLKCSLFSYYFCKAIENISKNITLESINNYINPKISNQHSNYTSQGSKILIVENESYDRNKLDLTRNNSHASFIPSENIEMKFNSTNAKLILKYFITSPNEESFSFEKEVTTEIKYNKQKNGYLILGESGVGKSIVAYALLKFISEKFKEVNTIFIDLMVYEKKIASGNKCLSDCVIEIKNRLMHDINKKNRLLIIDGVDNINPLSRSFFQLIIGLIDNDTYFLFKRTYKGIPAIKDDDNFRLIIFRKHYNCGLYNIKSTPKNHIKTIEILGELLNVENKNLINAKNKMSNWFFENKNNIRLLTMLLNPSLSNSIGNNSSKYFSLFFNNYLQKNKLNSEDICDIKRKSEIFSYNLLVKKEVLLPVSSNDFFVKRISTQSFEMLGYLSAKYICKEILRLGSDNNKKLTKDEIDNIDNVYPYLINKYAKEIINKNLNKQRDYFHAIIFIYDESSPRLQAFLCYLLGRFINPGICSKCIGFLNKKKIELDKKDDLLRKVNPDNEFLVLYRTIHISLIYLNQETDDKYIKKILSNHYLDAVNRGFHRQYYGDYMPDRDMISDDSDLGHFKNTFKKISDRLTGETTSLDGTLNLSVCTLLSLSMSRKQEGKLHETVDTKELLSLINYVINNCNLCKIVLSYAEITKYYLNSSLPPLTESLLMMYKLKENKRSGWNHSNKKILRRIDNPESVSEHTDFCIRIAQVFLPSNNKVKDLIKNSKLSSEYSNYSKEKIVSLLSIHDLGEYLYGDKVRMERTHQDRENELYALRRLSMLTSCHSSDILADPYSSIYLPWEEYNHHIKKDINYKIAKDIDNIECLIQLIIYHESEGNLITDFEDFKEGLISMIYTKMGGEILNVIIKPLIKKRRASPKKTDNR